MSPSVLGTPLRRGASGPLRATSLLSVLAIAVALPALGQSDEEAGPLPEPSGYREPAAPAVAVVDAPRSPRVSFNPSRTYMAVMARSGHPPISELAQPELRLAGVRFQPRTHGPSRARHYDDLRFYRVADGTEVSISGFPVDSRINYTRWSPTSRPAVHVD